MPTTNQPAPPAANAPAGQEKQVSQYTQDRRNAEDLLARYGPAIAQCLPKILTPERMIRVALTAMARTPKLLQCTQTSIIGAVMTCAQLGLLPDNVLGEAYMIPFNNTKARRMEVQVIIGYKGLCTLAMRSGQVKSIQAAAVYKGDFFDWELGLNEKCQHKPCGNINPNEITDFYAIVKFLSGGHVMFVMTKEAVEKVRDAAPNYAFAQDKPNTVWGKYFAEMGMKTVLRRTMKFVTLSPELTRAIAIDEAADAGYQKVNVDFMNVPEMPAEYAQEVSAEVMGEEADIRADELNKSRENSATRGQNAVDATLNLLDKKS